MRPERYSQLTSSCVGRTAKRKSSMKRAKKVTTVMAIVAYMPSRECDALALHEALSSKLSMSNMEPPAESMRHPICKNSSEFHVDGTVYGFHQRCKASKLSQPVHHIYPVQFTHVPVSLSLLENMVIDDAGPEHGGRGE